ncbi:hypothetical protein, partial [Asticcacaulis biprosthecium]|uniref:hypothetical protein n=1 Tax=Asticcacaulis biprosthecium TaxID=76891 RepID=UPI001B7FEFF2
MSQSLEEPIAQLAAKHGPTAVHAAAQKQYFIHVGRTMAVGFQATLVQIELAKAKARYPSTASRSPSP